MQLSGLVEKVLDLLLLEELAGNSVMSDLTVEIKIHLSMAHTYFANHLSNICARSANLFMVFFTFRHRENMSVVGDVVPTRVASEIRPARSAN
jgi:hypothetical protein